MTTNPYFSVAPKNFTQEQFLVEDLINESIKINGMNVVYIVRDQGDGGSQDLLYGEDPTAKFSHTYTIEMYMKDVLGGSGGDFLSKFGLQINDSCTFVMSRRSFNKTVPSSVATRPREGDLIYIPMNNNLYEIMYVDHESTYYTLGRNVSLPYLYELKVEQFKYSNENLDTGIPEIDSIEDFSSYSIEVNLSTNGIGNYNIGETVFQGANLSSAITVAKVTDWSPDDKIIKLVNIKGIISNTSNIIGSTSGTSYAVLTYDNQKDSSINIGFENQMIQIETDTFIVRDEIDPFGTS